MSPPPPTLSTPCQICRAFWFGGSSYTKAGATCVMLISFREERTLSTMSLKDGSASKNSVYNRDNGLAYTNLLTFDVKLKFQPHYYNSSKVLALTQ